MNKSEIISVLSGWNFWEREIDAGIKREQLGKTLDVVKSRVNKILIINGVRRCGKRFLAKQIVKEISKVVGSKNTLIVNFEEVAFDELLTEKFMLKVFEAYKEIVRADKKPLIVLDEVQEVKNWEKFVRSVHEKDEAKIIVTGSSSKLMSEEFATLLTGRTIEIKLFPLSFAEFLKFNNIEIKEQFEALIKKEELIKLLREYVEFGSFPEVTLESNEKLKKEIARKIYEDSLFKDVAKRYRIRNIVKLETLAKYYLSNISSPITFNRISKFLKLPVKTVELYSKYLETSNLLFFLKRFSFSVKMQENSPRKVYAVDVGLPNTIGFRFLENYGKLMENIVTIELLRKKFYFSPLFEVYYYKANDKEVDFVLKEGLKIKQLIQACYNIEDFNVKERELNALVKASKELKCKNLLVITWDYESVEEFKNKKIKFLPLWKWLLFT